VLSLESQWNPSFGDAFEAALDVSLDGDDRLDLGCVASRGWFSTAEGLKVDEGTTSATAFLFHVISRLQQLGTVPMIDMSAYAAHLP
jgi:hypothetical protein